MQERECASLGDMADQTAGRAADALEREMQRAEAAEVRVRKLENRDVEKLATWLTPAGIEKEKEGLDDGTVGEVLFIAAILRSMAEDTEAEANDLLADESFYGAEDAQGRADMYWHMHEAICEISEKGCTKAEARVKELEAQNARLRAALEDVSLLAHCISKAGPLNTPDLETAWRKFDLISVKAAEALVDKKAALNGEEPAP